MRDSIPLLKKALSITPDSIRQKNALLALFICICRKIVVILHPISSLTDVKQKDILILKAYSFVNEFGKF